MRDLQRGLTRDRLTVDAIHSALDEIFRFGSRLSAVTPRTRAATPHRTIRRRKGVHDEAQKAEGEGALGPVIKLV